MREIICIHIGGAGVQIGSACWELLCVEHRIEGNGLIWGGDERERDGEDKSGLFSEVRRWGKQVPRAVFIDTEPTVIDEIRNGKNDRLFHKDRLISGKGDVADVYSKVYSEGNGLAEEGVENIRKEVENCDSLQGFVVFSAVGGGTGSGLGALLLERMSPDYTKGKYTIGVTLYPSPNISTSVLEPYNSVLGTQALIEHMNLSILINNQALYHILDRYLYLQHATYTNLNRIIAEVVSSMTAPLRFNNGLKIDIGDLVSNLSPYPHIHFLHSSYAPILPIQDAYHQLFPVSHITKSVFNPHSIMANCDPARGKYIACSMFYRGDVAPGDVFRALHNIQDSPDLHFVDWCPTTFKVGMTYEKPMVVPGGDLPQVRRAVCMIANSTAISQLFAKVNHKFDLMYAKRAFVCHFASWMQEGLFSEGRENLAALEKDYEEVSTSTTDQIEDDIDY